MAVEQLFRSTFDKEKVFMTRGEAELHDLKLDVCDALGSLFRHVLPNLSEDDAETLGYFMACLLYTSPSPRDQRGSRMPSSA